MSKRVRRRRGTSTQHDEFTGAGGELTVNTSDHTVHVHDGSTAGGFKAARSDQVLHQDQNLSDLDDASAARASLGITGGGTFPNIDDDVTATEDSLNAASGIENNSIGSSGYQQLPGGLLLQWGSYVTGSGMSDLAGEANIGFPVSFDTALWSFTWSVEGSKNNITINAQSMDKDGANVWVTDLDNTTGESGVTIRWMALGDSPFSV